jgi:lysophospholipase L1-like esterase
MHTDPPARRGWRSRRFLVLLGAFLAAATASTALAAPAHADPALVPCWASGGGHYTCSWYPAGDGRSGGTPVLDGNGARVGWLHRGDNWIVCQQRGGRVTSGPYYNSWWGWTLTDYNGRWGWANAVNARGGDNEGGFGGGAPQCNGAHGNPPGGPASAPPPPPEPPEPAPEEPAPPPAALPRYVAMGDSYQSGEGADDYLPAAAGRPLRCHRSRNAYSQRLAARLAGRFEHNEARDFLACSGDEVPELLSRQVSRLSPDVGLITVGIGGNDAGWTQVLEDCMKDAVAHPRPGSGVGCKQIIDSHFADGLPRLRRRLGDAYTQIRRRAPNATVIVLGYPAIFEDSWRSTFCASVGPLTRGARSDLREGAEALDDTIRGVAERFGFRFVDPRAAFKNHRICSAGRDWLHGVTLERGELAISPSTFHPNGAGQAGFASLLALTNRDIFG